MSTSLPWLVRLARALPPLARHALSVPFGARLFRECMSRQGQSNGSATVVLSFDCDFPVDVEQLPALARALQGRGLQGSFAVVGQWVEKWPAEHRAIVDGGHELINHSHTHPNLRNTAYEFAASPDFTERVFSDMSFAEQREEIRLCHEAVRSQVGVEMRGCRLPHFGNLDPEKAYALLRELGYEFSSSLLAILAPTLGSLYSPAEGIVEIPVAGCPRHPFVAFDTWHCLVKDGGRHAGAGQFLRLMNDALDSCVRHGALLNLYFDPKDVTGNPDFDAFLDRLVALETVRTATYAELLSDGPGLSDGSGRSG